MNKIATVKYHLHAALVDTYALAVKTHAAHWNVTGASFFSLHETFGVQYLALLGFADEIAERLRALGESAPVGIQALAKATTLGDLDASDGRAVAKALRDDHRALAMVCAKGVAVSQKTGDEASADLFIGRIADHEKTAWMLDATAR